MQRHESRPVPLDIRGLAGGEELFRLARGSRRDAAVEHWLAGDPAELRGLARHWFAQLRDCGGDVLEQMHDGCPVACVGDAPFGYVDTFKAHVNLGFFYGAMLADPAGLLQGSGKRMRHVKLKPGAGPDVDALAALIGAAYVDIKARLAADACD